MRSDQILQQRDTDSRKGEQYNDGTDERCNLSGERGSCHRECAHAENRNTALACIRFAHEPGTEGGIGEQGNQADAALYNAGIAGRKPELILRVVIKALIETGLSHVLQHCHEEQAEKQRSQERPCSEEGGERIALPDELFLVCVFDGIFVVIHTAEKENHTGEQQDRNLCPDGNADTDVSQQTAHHVAEGTCHCVDCR